MSDMRLIDLLDVRRIMVGMTSSRKEDVLRDLARVAAREGVISEEEIVAALERRERLGPFSLGKGVAFPHARVEKEMDLSIAVGVVPEGCEITSPDGRPVRVVILFVVSRKQSDLYLKALAAFLNFLSSEENLNRMAAAASPEDVIRLISDDNQIINLS